MARGLRAAAWIALGMATTAPARAADPPIPPPAAPPPPPPAASREALLEERLQRMEAMNRKMADQFEAVIQRNEALEDRLKSFAGENRALSDKIDELSKRLTAPPPSTLESAGSSNPGTVNRGRRTAPSATYSAAIRETTISPPTSRPTSR